MTSPRILFAAFFVFGLGGLARASQIDFDPTTPVNMGSTGQVGLYSNGQQFTAQSNQSMLGSNYTQPGGTYDWGNDATAAETNSGLSGSGVSFVTFDGDGTDHVTVRMNAEAFASGTPPLAGGLPNGYAYMQFDLYAKLDNLTIGQQYTIDYDWSVNATAGAPIFYSGGSTAQGTMTLSTTGAPPAYLFNEQVNSIAGFPPFNITPSDSGSLTFLAGVSSQVMDLYMFSVSSASFDGSTNGLMQPFPNDQVGSTFYGEATFTLLPEPASLASLAIGAALLSACWGRRRRFGSAVR